MCLLCLWRGPLLLYVLLLLLCLLAAALELWPCSLLVVELCIVSILVLHVVELRLLLVV